MSWDLILSDKDLRSKLKAFNEKYPEYINRLKK